MNSDRISELYSMGEISGFAYLACVENDIDTVGDAVQKGILNDPSCKWTIELLPFVTPEQEEASSNPETPSNNASSSNETNNIGNSIVDKIRIAQSIHEELLKEVDVRTARAISQMQEQSKSFPIYLKKLIGQDWEFWNKFKSLHAVGRKSINRAKEFAKDVENGLKKKRMTVDDLFFQQPSQIEETDSINSTVTNSYLASTKFREDVQFELTRVSVRTRNALKLLLQKSDSYKDFYETIAADSFDIYDIRNIGRKSIPEVRNFIETLREYVSIHANDIGNTSVPIEISLEPKDYTALFEGRLQELSVRSYHVLNDIYEDCGKSVDRFFGRVFDANFNAYALPGIGKKSAEEIIQWLNSFKTLVRGGTESNKLAEREAHSFVLSDAGVRGNIDAIQSTAESLGHFPYFFAIQEYIQNLSERDKAIIDAQLKIYLNQTLQNRKVSAKNLKITPERMRQLRISIFDKLQKYIEALGKKYKSLSPDFLYEESDILHINEQEGTAFNENFILWVLSLILKNKFVLLGDPDTAFANPYGYEVNLVIVPKYLYDIFDFQSFIHHFERLDEEKRTDDMVISVQDCLLNFFKGRVYYEELDTISKYCCNIIQKSFNYRISGDSIIIERNASRNNSDWVELIIREVGHPLTIDEIYVELEKRHPGKSKSSFALAGAVRTNPNLVPIGRSSTFGLKEWSQGVHRGGTIREFATEYLLSLEKPIATLPEIGAYVRQFRPSSSDKSIHANLLLEANGAFGLFFKGENRYIGLSNYDYGVEYRKFDPIKDSKRDFKTSCTLLEEFVAEKGRLPFSNKEDEEEMRLCRFWNVQVSKYEKGQLQGDELSILESMIDRFSGLKIHKKAYDWLQNFETIKRALENGFGLSSLSQEKQTWLNNQVRAWKYGRLSPSYIENVDELIKLIEKNVKRV